MSSTYSSTSSNIAPNISLLSLAGVSPWPQHMQAQAAAKASMGTAAVDAMRLLLGSSVDKCSHFGQKGNCVTKQLGPAFESSFLLQSPEERGICLSNCLLQHLQAGGLVLFSLHDPHLWHLSTLALYV